MKKPNVNHGLQRRSQILDDEAKIENRIKIGEILFYIHNVDEYRNILLYHKYEKRTLLSPCN
jgi:hypothetical protein